MNSIDLSAFFQTKLQSSDFSSQLAKISEKLYETDFTLEKALLEQFGLKKKDQFIALLRDQNVSIDSNTALKNFLSEVQKTISSLPILTLTIAFEPKEQTMRALSEWFVLNIKHQVLFDIQVDPKLIAGASISFNGRNADYSIREKLEKAIEDLQKKPVHAAPPSQPNHHEQQHTGAN